MELYTERNLRYRLASNVIYHKNVIWAYGLSQKPSMLGYELFFFFQVIARPKQIRAFFEIGLSFRLIVL